MRQALHRVTLGLHLSSRAARSSSRFTPIPQTQQRRFALRPSKYGNLFSGTPGTPFLEAIGKRQQERARQMSEPEAKRQRMTAPLIGTHSGHFHADEALAVYLLRLLPQYQNSSLVRTRDPDVLKTCDTVVDVGGVHDNSAKRYDHHQREFAATFPSHATKLSSAGLVWMHMGRDVVCQCTGMSKDDSDAELLYQKLYDDFVEAFDANDNGISLYDPLALRKAGIEKRFSEKGFSLAGVVNRMNYSHPSPVAAVASSMSTNGKAADSNITAPAMKSKDEAQAEEDARFLKASQFVGEQFLSELSDKFRSWLPARTVVKHAFSERQQYDSRGRIMVIPHRPEGVPWADHVYAMEEECSAQGQVLYVLFAENGEADSKWRIRSVSLEPGSFENRKDLPDAWKGLRDEKLSEVSGVPGGVFIHAGGFIGGNKTFDGALKMAQKAVEM